MPLRALLRLATGPLALAAFFQPWVAAKGPLAGTELSGYELVGLAGRIQAANLEGAPSGLLLAMRFLMLGVAIAAVWQLLLAPRWRGHPAYRASGWYLTAAAVLLAIGSMPAGATELPLGITLLLLASGAFVGAECGPWTARRLRAAMGGHRRSAAAPPAPRDAAAMR